MRQGGGGLWWTLTAEGSRRAWHVWLIGCLLIYRGIPELDLIHHDVQALADCLQRLAVSLDRQEAAAWGPMQEEQEEEEEGDAGEGS
jgi:hypothetical protein